jgi:hypothetical protein
MSFTQSDRSLNIGTRCCRGQYIDTSQIPTTMTIVDDIQSRLQEESRQLTYRVGCIIDDTLVDSYDRDAIICQPKVCDQILRFSITPCLRKTPLVMPYWHDCDLEQSQDFVRCSNSRSDIAQELAGWIQAYISDERAIAGSPGECGEIARLRMGQGSRQDRSLNNLYLSHQLETSTKTPHTQTV